MQELNCSNSSTATLIGETEADTSCLLNYLLAGLYQ